MVRAARGTSGIVAGLLPLPTMRRVGWPGCIPRSSTLVAPIHAVSFGGLPGRFSGGRFDLLAGGGDRSDVADVFTSDDIVAVSLLGARIPGAPALALTSCGGRLSNCPASSG